MLILFYFNICVIIVNCKVIYITHTTPTDTYYLCINNYRTIAHTRKSAGTLGYHEEQ
jgi:hypothetical protein